MPYPAATLAAPPVHESGAPADPLAGVPAAGAPARGVAPAAGPRAGERWLVLAPHPDDETIATGGLLQRVRASGAVAHVALLTDGGGDTWPQRCLERRWRIGAADRARWARRRRDECDAALRVLGLDPRQDLSALGGEDGALTAAFCADPATALAPLRSLLRRFAPTDVVLPAADDRHPDHNLAPVLLALALEGTGREPRLHAFRVHGGSRGDSLRLELTPQELARKRAALACHATQLALSRRRFTALAGEVECFDSDPFGTALRRSSGWPRALEALLGALAGRWQWRVVGRDASGLPRVESMDADSEDPGNPPQGMFVKLEASRRGPWIYDAHGWRRQPDHPRPGAGG